MVWVQPEVAGGGGSGQAQEEEEEEEEGLEELHARWRAGQRLAADGPALALHGIH